MAALSSISEVFSSKRFRSTPLAVLEPIMLRFLELCVDLRKGRTAKDGLILYKNVAQNTSVQSVEVTINKLLNLSRQKLADSLAKVDELEGAAGSTSAAAAGTGGDVDDLEATETPESILLGAVSDDKSRDRTYRALVTPWLRFLWESYRTALDILRNNARLETLYQTVCHDAFQFCLAHQRKTEFRRLCETLRSHLASSQKYTHQSHSINLNEPDTLQRHLDTRFQQLSTAVELELWQEAFRTAEDIHTLVGMSKRAPKGPVMASFYDKMAKVFAVGDNFLFHAAAYGKLYSLHSARLALQGGDSKGEDGELEKLASRVLLSALAVPVGSGVVDTGRGRSASAEGPADEGESKGRLGRLASLIGLAGTPTRAGLINDALSRHALKRVSPQLRELYQILEVDFHPLSITAKIDPILAELEKQPETARYVAPLKEVVLARLFQQLAQVYSSLKLDRVVKLASFAADGDRDATRRRVERYVTEACRRGDVDVTIDHAAGSIKFDQALFGDEAAASAGYDSVKTLQPSASTLLRTHLTRLATTLHSTLNAVASTSQSQSPAAVAQSAREQAFAKLATAVADERDTVLARTMIIKRRKELAEEQSARKEQEDAHLRSVRAAQKAEEDARRQKDELRQRELDRIKREMEKVKADEAKKVAESLIQSGLKVDKQKLPELSANDLVQLQVQQIEKDKKDLAQKLTSVHKRIDHLERAYRREEIPLIAEDYKRQQTRDREAFESAQVQRAEESRQKHARGLAIKASLQRILPDYSSFRERQERESREAYEAERRRLDDQLAEAKAERRRQILAEREEERQAEIRRQQEEEERRVREEEHARIRAEQEAREAEERAKIEERQREAAARAEAEARKALEERLAQRKADQEKIQAQYRREEEALARRQGRQPQASGPGAAATVGLAAWRSQRDASAPSSTSPSPATSTERPRFNLQPRTGAAPPAERPRMALQPRSSPRPDAPPVPAIPAGAGVSANMGAPAAAAAPPAKEDSRSSSPAAGQQGRYVPPSARNRGGAAGGGGGRW
ncbi:eukaryotic translation initiation factor 3 subunit A [Rhodotorula sphaerocarpa]